MESRDLRLTAAPEHLAPEDKISVPSVKISTQAILLQMAVAKELGIDQAKKFDSQTVSMSHPDAVLAIVNNTSGINSHFTNTPFYEQETQLPDVHVIASSLDILGPFTSLVVSTSVQFKENKPQDLRCISVS